MDAAREREREDAQAEAAAAPVAVAESPATAGPLSPARVMALQRLVGNAAVAGMLNGGAEMAEREPAKVGELGGLPPQPAAGGASAAPERHEAGAAGAAAAGPAPAGEAFAAGGGGGAPPAAAAAAAPAAGAPEQQAAGPAGAATAAPGGEAAPRMNPHDDPNFQAMKANTGAAGAEVKSHQPASAGAAASQGAAQPPGNEVASQAQAEQLEEMAAQQPGAFDRVAFMNAVRKSIDAAAPKNLEDVDDFKSSGKAAQVKQDVGSQVKSGKQTAEKDIKQATVAPPDTSKATPKEVVPLPAEQPGAKPGPVGAGAAMPLPRPAEETDLSQGPADVDAKMAESEITEEQLQESNEPDFMGALEARRQVGEHAEAGPARYRAQEQEVLGESREDADAEAAAGLEAMHGDKVKALAKVTGHKGVTKGADEAKRANVAADIQGIYDRTKADVTATLDGIDPKVDAAFTRGEEAARKQFEDEVGAKMDAYKDDRYSGWFGWARWLDDKLFGMPGEVNAFYTEGRATYLTKMDAVIGEVADIVGQGLTDARTKIADGRAEVHAYVVQLPQDLKQVGKEAEDKLDSQFEELEGDVDSKQGELVDSLAQKYVAASDALDARITELKDANKGYVEKAIDAAVGVAKAIWRLKDLLFSVLAKAVSVIGDIVAHPIDFVRHLGESFKAGFDAFSSKIGDYLKETLVSWLFGTLEAANITLPKTWDLAGVFELVAQILGLSYDSIKDRLGRVLGVDAVAKLEEQVDVFKVLAKTGISGIWDLVATQIGNFEEVVLGPLKDFVIERVIRAGVPTLLAMLNPATAFIRACIAIYDFIKFLLDKGQEIVDFIDRLLDSVSAIAKGDISGAAAHIENTLKQGLKLAISLLASVMRLGGLPEKITSIIETVRKPVRKAVDTIIMGAVKGAKHIIAKPAAYAKDKYAKAKAKVLGGDDTLEGKQQRLSAGMRTAVRAANALPGRFAGRATLTALFAPIRLRFGMTKLVPVPHGDRWAVEGQVNPGETDEIDKEIDPKEKGTPETTEEPATTPPATPEHEDPAIVRARNKAKERVSELKAGIRRFSTRARQTVARLLSRPGRNALAKRGAAGQTVITGAEALKIELDTRKVSDDAALAASLKVRTAAEEIPILATQEEALRGLRTALEAMDARATALESGAPDPKAGDPKAKVIASITGSIQGARAIWAEPEVVDFLAKTPAARADFERKLGSIPRMDQPMDTWLAELKTKDLPELETLDKAAKAVNSRAIALRKRANPIPLKDQRERKPKGAKSDLVLVNPGSLFPDQLCDEIDGAQDTLDSNNKESDTLAEKSTQFAALAEAINGGMLPELRGTDHRGKNADNASAYKDYKDEISKLLAQSPAHRPELVNALRILGQHAAEATSADIFVIACRDRKPGDPWPDIPAWVSGKGRTELERRMRDKTPAPTH